MTTFGLPLDQLTAAQLDSLVANGVSEGRQLDYKEELPISSDKDKHDFLGDVTAFANTVGGDIIYGVREARDTAGKPSGVPEKIVGLPGVNIDQLKLTLDNLLRTAVDPRIPGLALQAIPRGAEPTCLLVRTPKTTLGLHMVTFKDLGRFYGRATSGNYLLDSAQIRDAFVQADIAVERARSFRRERVAAVLSGDTPIPVGVGPKAIFHLLPLTTAADAWARFRAGNMSDLALQLPTLDFAMAVTWRHNLDGFVVHTVHNEMESQTYAQLFRDGGIEAVSPNVVILQADTPSFNGRPLETAMIGRMTAYQGLWSTLGVTGPVMAALTLSGVKGAAILAGPEYVSFDPKPFTADVINVPEIVIQDAATPSSQALKPLVDILWNGGGWAGSPFYTATGEWKPPQQQ